MEISFIVGRLHNNTGKQCSTKEQLVTGVVYFIGTNSMFRARLNQMH